jgi:integrase
MLSQRTVDRVTKPGRYRDRGGMPGLLLNVSATGAKSWLLRFELNGIERMMGLGGAKFFSLKEARERARAARQQLADGVDPLQAKTEAKAAAKLAAAKQITFAAAAAAYAAQHERRWSNKSHRDQFLNTLRTYAFPVFGDVGVATIDTTLVLKAVEPIWSSKTTTASRVLTRIENVLDWCTMRQARTGDNPARWTGHLDQVLPKRGDIAKVRHLAAMPYTQLPSFMAELRASDSLAARALEFTILTSARTGETIGARWEEIEGDTWTVPAARMKGRQEHRVPLSAPVLALLHALPTEAGNPFVFIGAKPGVGLSDAPMQNTLKLMGQPFTVHGMRSAFRDWCSEQTAYPADVIELSLAHAVGNKVARAYARSDQLDKRRSLMAAWAKYCSSPGAAGDVVPIRR